MATETFLKSVLNTSDDWTSIKGAMIREAKTIEQVTTLSAKKSQVQKISA